MSGLVVLSHTYVERANRGKLRALAAAVPVTAVVPDRWAEGALGHAWRLRSVSVEEGVTVVPVPWLGPFRPSFGVMRIPAARLGAADVLQIEEEAWTPTAFLASRRRAAVTVLFTWENLPRRVPPPWAQLQRTTLARLDGLIAGSTGAADEARRRGYAGPVAVIPQLGVEAVDVTAAPRAGGPLRVAFVGRLRREKGVDVLLRALARVGADARLRIVGDGPERGALQRLAAEAGVADRVEFLGAWPHERVSSLWRDTDVLVLPSRSTPRWREQLGHVLLEAMAHRVAVVGASCGAIPEVIGDAGLVFPEGESEALAEHLTFLAGDADATVRLAEAGWRRVAAEYTDRRIADRTLAFHADLMARR